MGFLSGIELLQTGKIARFTDDPGGRFVVGVPGNPIRCEDDPGPMGSDLPNHLELVFPVRLDAPVRHVQRLVHGHAHHLGSGREFTRPDLGAAPGAHLAAGQRDDSGRVALGPQFDDRPSAPELHIVGMRTERDDVKLHCFPDRSLLNSHAKDLVVEMSQVDSLVELLQPGEAVLHEDMESR